VTARARGTGPGARRAPAAHGEPLSRILAGARPAAALALVLVAAGCASRGGAPPRGGGAAPDTLGAPEIAERETGPEARGLPQFTLLYFNDLHGHLVPFTREGAADSVGGAARMAALVARIREENDRLGRPTLLVEGGDVFQGTPLSSVFRGEPEIRFMNLMGVDAMVIGNHEFDFGLEVLRERMADAEFPMLAANVVEARTGRPLAPASVVRLLPNGVRVGILGLVTDDTPRTTSPSNVRGLVFEPPLLAAGRHLPALEDRAEVIVALTHIGSRADRQLAVAYDDIDVVVGGHDQVLIARPFEEDDVLVAQVEEYGLYLGRLDLAVEEDEVELLADTVYPITEELPDDPRVAEMIAGYTSELDRELGKVVGSLAAPLEGGRDAVRRRQTNFGRLLADLMRRRAAADVALLNAGAIRASVDAGPVTLGELVQALPFTNRILAVRLTGDALARVLDRSAAEGRRGDSGAYLQTSGVDGAPGSWRVNGRPLDPAAELVVAITDFLWEGGDGYDAFRTEGRDLRDAGATLVEELVRLLARESPLRVPGPPSAL
jgi:2',3'-cyclic-nucleotide 2'-phosphodiesterase (5'-nucleotidase family)